MSFPKLLDDKIWDVLIIGSGILGAGTGYACIKSKCLSSTIILEQYSSHQHENGASFGSARAWRMAYTNPIYANMMLKSLKIWKEIEALTSTNLLKYCGGLDFSPTDCNKFNNIINTLKMHKSKYEIFSAQDTLKRFTFLNIPSNYRSVYIPNEHGTINPNKALNAIIECSIKLGIKIKYNHKVTKIKKLLNDKLLYEIYCKNGNTFIAKNIVIACGAYPIPQIMDNRLNNKLLHLRRSVMKPIAQKVVYFCLKNDDKFRDYPCWAEYNDDDEDNLCSWYGMICPMNTPFGIKYCMKVGGVGLNNEYKHIIKYVNNRFNAKINKWEIFASKKCYDAKIKDDNFIIDRIDKNENIFLLSGALHSYKVATQIGEIIKDLIIKNIEKPHPLFQIQRFQQNKL